MTHPQPTFERFAPLTAARPFSFAHSLSFLCSFPPTAGEQTTEGRALSKAISIDGRAYLATVREVDDQDQDGPAALTLALAGDAPIADPTLARAAERVRFQLGLDDDLAPFYARARADEAFAPLARRFFGHHHVKFPSPFEIAAWAVLAQRNMRLGRKVKDGIVEALGPRVTVGGVTHRAFPEPGAMPADARLRTIVGDAAKADAIATIARAFREEDLAARLLTLPYDAAEARLRDLPRIGPWSSAFILFRGLGRMERLAERSGPILEAAARLYRTRDERALRAIGDGYGPWCGYWALYLRRS